RYIAVRDLETGVDEYVTSGEQAVFGPDGRTVYARSDAGEFPALIRFLDGTAEVLAASEIAEVESFAMTAIGGTAAVLWNRRGGMSELVVQDLVTGGHRLVSPLPGNVVSGLAWSADGST